ncbi:MAG: hypothetical protein Tsb0014_42380 [Pleurocapsa sp.]
MKIQSVIVLHGHILFIYGCSEGFYHFSFVDIMGKSYISHSSFPSVDSAKFMAVAAIKRAREKPKKQPE